MDVMSRFSCVFVLNADRSMKQIYASEINELTYHLRVTITLGSPTCIFLFQLCGFIPFHLQITIQIPSQFC
jgi:hypothetical protein